MEMQPTADVPGSWSKLPRREGERRAINLAVQYLEASRRGDYKGMIGMHGPHDGALMAALIHCASIVVPVFRESVGDEGYLEIMDGLAPEEDGQPSVLPTRMALQMLDAQGGLELEGRWMVSDTPTLLTPELVQGVNLFMATLLLQLISISADETGRDEDEAFRHFIALLAA